MSYTSSSSQFTSLAHAHHQEDTQSTCAPGLHDGCSRKILKFRYGSYTSGTDKNKCRSNRKIVGQAPTAAEPAGAYIDGAEQILSVTWQKCSDVPRYAGFCRDPDVYTALIPATYKPIFQLWVQGTEEGETENVLRREMLILARWPDNKPIQYPMNAETDVPNWAQIFDTQRTWSRIETGSHQVSPQKCSVQPNKKVADGTVQQTTYGGSSSCVDYAEGEIQDSGGKTAEFEVEVEWKGTNG